MKRPRPATLASLAFVLTLFALLVWRAAIPANRERGGMDYLVVRTNGESHYLPRNANTYENVVTAVTARHFARDGFLRSHFLPNRGGAPNVSLYDFSQTQCEPLGPAATPLKYRNFFGQERSMHSLNGDCIYTHYPPLADWLFGILASFGCDQVLHYKLVAIALNSLLAWLLYRWLQREVEPGAALVAAALIATTPAFVQWADTLYYHGLQYLLLIAGLLSFRRYLRGSRLRWFALTWVLYLAESLASYQLTLFFGVALAGQQLLATRLDRRALLSLLGLAAAPVVAFAAHFTLIVSLLGWERATRNVGRTYADRVTVSYPAGLRDLLGTVPEGLVPWSVLLAGLGLVLVVRREVGAPLRRPLAWLGVLGAGAVSFMLAFPGTTSWHAWMMYRQFLPVVALLVGLVADAVWLAWRAWRSARTDASRRGVASSRVLLSCAVVGSLLLGWVGFHNLRRIHGEVLLNVARARAYQPDNLVGRALDAVYWTDAGREPKGLAYLPVSGLLAAEPPSWNTDFRLPGPEPSHYEVWWLDPVAIGRVRLLVDSEQAASVAERCSLAFFDGLGFRPGAALAPSSATHPASPPRSSWLEARETRRVSTRATRLTCSGLDHVTLRQIQVFDEDAAVHTGQR